MFRVLMFASALFVLSTLPAQAASIGIVSHDYGIGKHDPGGNDVLGTDWVTVSDQSSGRFNDVFDFSHLLYDSISHFELTLTYSDTSGSELWAGRPAQSTTVGWTPGVLNLNLLPFVLSQAGTTPLSTTMEINGTQTGGASVFSTIVTTGLFYLWFAEGTGGSDSFTLYSASLEVFGEPTPASVPDVASTMLLFGVGLGFVAGASRLMRARQSARL